MATLIKPEPLTREGFAPFGDVIETEGAQHFTINSGLAERFHDLARIEVAAEGGRPLISIVRGEPRPQPIRLSLMERHPLASQAFFPLQDRTWLVIVGEGDEACDARRLRAFRATGRQGVNYAPGVWHHPLVVLEPGHEFLVIDRGGAGGNLEEVPFPDNFEVLVDL